MVQRSVIGQKGPPPPTDHLWSRRVVNSINTNKQSPAPNNIHAHLCQQLDCSAQFVLVKVCFVGLEMKLIEYVNSLVNLTIKEFKDPTPRMTS